MESAAWESREWELSLEQGRSRSAWGDRPADGTMASVVVSVPMPRHRDDYDDERSTYDRAPRRARRRYDDYEESRLSERSWQYTVQSVVVHAISGSQRAYAQSRTAFGAVFRWMRTGFADEIRPAQRAINLVLLLCILGSLVLSGAGVGLAALNDYNHIKNLAYGGLKALQNVPGDLGIKQGATGQRATAAQVQAANDDINLALNDFLDLNDRLVHSDPILTLAGNIGSLRAKLESGVILSEVAIDGARLMQAFLPALTVLANVISTSPLTTTNTGDASKLLTPADIPVIQQSLANAGPYVDDIVAKVESTTPKALLSALPSSNQTQIAKYLRFVPMLQPTLSILSAFLPATPSLLGMTNPANYLIMTLDSAEIRPIGGFQGQFAIVNVNAGRIGQIKLRDVYQIEPVDTGNFGIESTRTYGRVGQYAPANFGNYGWFNYGWALRNSGLSPDVTQSGEYALNQVESEIKNFGNQLPTKLDTNGHPISFDPMQPHFNGVIFIQATLISQVLQLAGKIHIPTPYNVDVTAQNVAQQIHYYQETEAGRQVGQQVPGNSTATKRFTELLSQALMDKVRTMPKDRLLDLVGVIVQDLHTRDITMYFRDPQVEDLLRRYQISSEIYQGTMDDSLIINDANISGNKIDQYLTEVITDNITLDSRGNATHQLQIEYRFALPAIKGDPNAPGTYGCPAVHPPDPKSIQAVVYNVIYNACYDAFARDYRRIYISPRAGNLSNWQGFAFNGGDFGSIASQGVQPEFYYQGDLQNHDIIGGYYIYYWHALDDGTVQWGTPNNQPIVQVNWRVLKAYTPGGSYTLHFQRQSGMNIGMNITITPPACSGARPLHVEGPMTTDQLLSINVPKC